MTDAVDHKKRYGIFNLARVMGGLMVLAFVAGIVPDLDHPLAILLGISDERFLHPYFAVIGSGFVGGGIILAFACLCRCIQLRLLKKK